MMMNTMMASTHWVRCKTGNREKCKYLKWRCQAEHRIVHLFVLGIVAGPDQCDHILQTEQRKEKEERFDRFPVLVHFRITAGVIRIEFAEQHSNDVDQEENV